MIYCDIQEEDLRILENGNILKGEYWTYTQPFGNNVYNQYNDSTYGFIYMNEKIESFEDIIIFDKNSKSLIPVIQNPGSSGSFEVKLLLKSCTLEQKIYFICKKWKQKMETSISRRNIYNTPNKKRKISNNGINVHIN
tara:strand:+ start:35 stop:448 length:414 start_codon:yes stop_codon:yes gene_type:complete